MTKIFFLPKICLTQNNILPKNFVRPNYFLTKLLIFWPKLSFWQNVFDQKNITAKNIPSQIPSQHSEIHYHIPSKQEIPSQSLEREGQCQPWVNHMICDQLSSILLNEHYHCNDWQCYILLTLPVLSVIKIFTPVHIKAGVSVPSKLRSLLSVVAVLL